MGEGTYVSQAKPKMGNSRAHRLPFDVPLLLIVVVLLVFGLLMVYSASWDFSISMGEAPTYLFGRQILWVLLGLVAATVASLVDYHLYQKILVPMGLGTLAPFWSSTTARAMTPPATCWAAPFSPPRWPRL